MQQKGEEHGEKKLCCCHLFQEISGDFDLHFYDEQVRTKKAKD